MTERPPDMNFMIDDAIGISVTEFDSVVEEMYRIRNSVVDAEDFVKEAVKDRDLHDVVAGFVISRFLSINEGEI